MTSWGQFFKEFHAMHLEQRKNGLSQQDRVEVQKVFSFLDDIFGLIKVALVVVAFFWLLHKIGYPLYLFRRW